MGMNVIMDKPIMEGTWDAFKSGFVTGFITGFAGPLANAVKAWGAIAQITVTVAVDIVGTIGGMLAIGQFSLKDLLMQGGISLLINIVTHKNFMPKFKANVSERFKFKLAGDVPDGYVPSVHPDEPNIKGPHPDDPNAPVKPNDKAPSKDLGDGHKATLDENGVPIVCSKCDILRKRFKDVLANMSDADKKAFE